MKNIIPSIIFLLLCATGFAQLPEGFEHTLFTNQAPNITTLEFAENGYIYGSEFSGKVWLFIDGELQAEPVINISDEVADYGELGCLALTLHPDFMENGYIYMFYVVDRHHLEYFGTPDYDPEKDQDEEATIGRIARFKVSTDDYKTLVPGSRTVIFGETYGEGNAALTLSHGTGDILFGADGSLIFSTGDGNTWENNYAGGDDEKPSTSFAKQGLADGIISEEEHVGSFRAQQIQSYSGKVLRVDPMTGEGLPSNPFYDEDDPNAPQSKVWALGLRNPYRMALAPGTGSKNPEDGNPGTLYITDVGAAHWEEINICDGPAINFGWPLYEGMELMWGFYMKTRNNKFQPNPLGDDCNRPYFTFQELIQQEKESHNYHYPNPCNTLEDIADVADVFHHNRPSLTYRNDKWNQNGSAPLLPVFDDEGEASAVEYTTPALGIIGAEDFAGIAAMVGDVYTGDKFPEEYHNILPVLDYNGWLKVFWFNEQQELQRTEHWLNDLENVIDIRFNPNDECYYTLALWPAQIHKICYSGNLSPVLDVGYSPEYGPSPLQVNFDASKSYDPENGHLTYEWDFGDGSTDTGAVVDHEYIAPDASPHSFEATVTASDSVGNQSSRTVLISLNNTPPEVDITSVEENQLYSMHTITQLPLEASVMDEEHTEEALSYQWTTYLHHNTHFHPVLESMETTATFNVNPVGCGPVSEYFYRIALRVTDAEGLEGYDELYIYPDCEGVLQLPQEFHLFPNPARNRLRFRFLDAEEKKQEYYIQVFNMNGQQVIEGHYTAGNSENKVDLNVEPLSQGMYLYRAISEKDKEYTGKFMIVR